MSEPDDMTYLSTATVISALLFDVILIAMGKELPAISFALIPVLIFCLVFNLFRIFTAKRPKPTKPEKEVDTNGLNDRS